ncbi:MAG TPA: ABATE domain-containing protein [Glaciibacter sp.]|nr:ABATE domain-containing protein [Glaciibacter sp.]
MDATLDVPGPVRLVRDFVNTFERQTNAESLATPADLVRWLDDHGVPLAGLTIGASELESARSIREGLRSVLQAHAGHDVDRDAIETLNRALAAVPLALAFSSSATQSLVPAKSARNRAALAPVIAAVNASQLDGTWERLKVCARDSCRWAFYDASRNRSGRWCSMAGCGNYVKMRRAYAVRTGRPVPGIPGLAEAPSPVE